MKKIKKNKAMGIAILVILLSFIVGYYLVNQPPSVEELKENPEAFNLSSYRYEEELQTVLKNLFPIDSIQSDVISFLDQNSELCVSDEFNISELKYNNPSIRKPINNEGTLIGVSNKSGKTRILFLFDVEKKSLLKIDVNIIGAEPFPESLGSRSTTQNGNFL